MYIKTYDGGTALREVYLKGTPRGSVEVGALTSVFANGMGTVASSTEYVMFSKASGVPFGMGRGDCQWLSKNGKRGLKIGDNGILATSNGFDSNGYGEIMYGIAAWGIIDTTTGSLLRSWVSSVSGITGLYASSKAYATTGITMMGSNFISSVNYAVIATANNTGTAVVFASVLSKTPNSFTIFTGDGKNPIPSEAVFYVFNFNTYAN